MSADPATVGARVLAALERGRSIAIEQARSRGAATTQAVRRALDLDVLDGHGERGRAGRIALRLRGRVSPRQVQRILVALSSASGSL